MAYPSLPGVASYSMWGSYHLPSRGNHFRGIKSKSITSPHQVSLSSSVQWVSTTHFTQASRVLSDTRCNIVKLEVCSKEAMANVWVNKTGKKKKKSQNRDRETGSAVEVWAAATTGLGGLQSFHRQGWPALGRNEGGVGRGRAGFPVELSLAVPGRPAHCGIIRDQTSLYLLASHTGCPSFLPVSPSLLKQPSPPTSTSSVPLGSH